MFLAAKESDTTGATDEAVWESVKDEFQNKYPGTEAEILKIIDRDNKVVKRAGGRKRKVEEVEEVEEVDDQLE